MTKKQPQGSHTPRLMLAVTQFGATIVFQEIARNSGKITVRFPAFVNNSDHGVGFTFAVIRHLHNADIYVHALLAEVPLPVYMVDAYTRYIAEAETAIAQQAR